MCIPMIVAPTTEAGQCVQPPALAHQQQLIGAPRRRRAPQRLPARSDRRGAALRWRPRLAAAAGARQRAQRGRDAPALHRSGHEHYVCAAALVGRRGAAAAHLVHLHRAAVHGGPGARRSRAAVAHERHRRGCAAARRRLRLPRHARARATGGAPQRGGARGGDVRAERGRLLEDGVHGSGLCAAWHC
jgi:hypothetical protein